jgi:WD40 repeat protein
VFRGHEKGLRRAVFSPDGRQILTASDDETARLWDLQGNLLTEFPASEDRVDLKSAVFSPDGSQILTVHMFFTAQPKPGTRRAKVRLWDTKGNLPVVFRGHKEPIETAIFNRDGSQILTASKDKTVRLWDIKGNLLAEFRGPEQGVTSAVFSPDRSQILTASGDGTARVWDTKGNLLAVFRGHEKAVRSAVFSPDGRQILTASSDRTARLWDISVAIAAQAEQMAARKTFQENPV